MGETYNIGGGVQQYNLDVIEQLCSALDEAVPSSPYVPHRQLIKFVADRPGHDRRYAIDASKIEKELGWRPRHTLSHGMRETVSWYVHHRDWIEAIRRQTDYRTWMEKNYGKRDADYPASSPVQAQDLTETLKDPMPGCK